MTKKIKWFVVSQVHPLVYAIREKNHWEDVVSYLLIGKSKAYLVDTGMGYESIKKEVKRITSLPIIVLLTHAHWDHIGGAHEFDSVHIFDDAFEKSSLARGFASADIEELNQPYFLNGFLSKPFFAEGKKEHTVFTDNTILEEENFSIYVIHTPGHTPGSVCFWVPEHEFLFTGDTIYSGPEYLFLPESDFSEYKKSVAKLCNLTKKSQKIHIFPGHNSVIEDSALLQNHHLALTGKLPALEIKSGENLYGKYIEYVYIGFSLLVDPLDPLEPEL